MLLKRNSLTTYPRSDQIRPIILLVLLRLQVCTNHIVCFDHDQNIMGETSLLTIPAVSFVSGVLRCIIAYVSLNV